MVDLRDVYLYYVNKLECYSFESAEAYQTLIEEIFKDLEERKAPWVMELIRGENKCLEMKMIQVILQRQL